MNIETNHGHSSKANWIYWIKYAALLMVGLFFLVFGIQVLFLAYQLNDPFAFVMTFFASNLMILISAALALVFLLKLFRSRTPKPDHDGTNGGEQ